MHYDVKISAARIQTHDEGRGGEGKGGQGRGGQGGGVKVPPLRDRAPASYCLVTGLPKSGKTGLESGLELESSTVDLYVAALSRNFSKLTCLNRNFDSYCLSQQHQMSAGLGGRYTYDDVI